MLKVYEREELGAGGGVVAEAAQHRGGFHDRVLLLHAAHHHAHVLGFDDDADAFRFGNVHDGFGNLRRELFLNLESTSVQVDDTGYLGQAQHFSRGYVSCMAFADEGQQVVFAQGVQFDVLHDHHLAGVGGEQGAVDDIVDLLAVALGQELEGLGGAFGCVYQPRP